MFLVLKKSSIKRNLSISLLMILIGLTLINPFKAEANVPQAYLTSPNIFYLYPHSNGMFWLESNPQAGYGTLKEWSAVLPKGEMIVATNRQLASLGGLDRIGKYVQGKIKGSGTNGKYDKDVFKYRRTVTAEGVTDEIQVEIGKHFRDNNNIDNLISQVKKHLTTGAGETQGIKGITLPQPVPETEEGQAAKAQVAGYSMLLGGLWMMAKVLVFAL